MPKYKYEALASSKSSFRVFQLLPGLVSDPILVHIQPALFSSTECPSYEALSYTWGSPENPETIYIIDQKPNAYLAPVKQSPSTEKGAPKVKDFLSRTRNSARFNNLFKRDAHSGVEVEHDTTYDKRPDNSIETPFQIRQNLFHALVYLRDAEKPRTLWIDAICIDQENLDERNREVRKMGSIYGKASGVIVWLGQPSEDSAKGLETLAYLGRQVEYDRANQKVKRAAHADAESLLWSRSGTLLPYNEATWKAIIGIMGREYFTRVWIWQEIHLAVQDKVSMLCGEAEASWTHFSNGIACLFAKTATGPQGPLSTEFETKLDLIRRLVVISSGDTMLGCLRGMYFSLCTDPRDRIYSLLDLAADSAGLNIQPDYGKSVADVYREYVIACMRNSNRLNVLSDCDVAVATEGFTNQPCWIPRWGQKRPYLTQMRSLHVSSVHGTFAVSGNVLMVKGAQCGIISERSAIVPSKSDSGGPNQWSIIQDFLRKLGLDTEPGPEVLKICEPFLQIMCHYRLNNNHASRFPSRRLMSPADAMTALLHLLDDSAADEPNQANIKRLQMTIDRHLIGRRFFRTTDGNIGLGPSDAQVGDSVYSILGCEKLLVLRDGSEDEVGRRIVGACSLHRSMDLQALLGPLPAGWYIEEGSPKCQNWEMWFIKIEEGKKIKTRIDPRLGEEHRGWQVNKGHRSGLITWREMETGKETIYDPRHSDVNFLRQRGVDIRDIHLI